MIKLSAVDKAPTPERDDDHPALRGEKIHLAAEQYVRGDLEDLPHTLRKFKTQFVELAEDYSQGKVILEEEWGYTKDWAPTGYFDKDVWVRLKLDALVKLDANSARVIDYKTGKKLGNEVKHMQQAQLYAVGTFLRYPEIDVIQTEFWYTDQGITTTKIYRRQQFLQYMKRFTERGIKVTTDTIFRPKPGKYTCKWCDFGKETGTDSCPFAYED